MKDLGDQNVLDEGTLIHGKLAENPLVCGIQKILDRVTDFKERVRSFYFEVFLSVHRCTKCGGRLKMTGQSECTCSCGFTFDPTIAFQNSNCCNARLVRKTLHYACSKCSKIIQSRFLFDERVFDKAYFREIMQESRKRAKHKKEEIQRILAENRSGVLTLLEEPDLDSIPGLLQDLDDFIQPGDTGQFIFHIENNSYMNDYRNNILSVLTWNGVLFSDITPLIADFRRDRIRRFITLIFMQNDREIELTQYENDILIEKAQNEAYG